MERRKHTNYHVIDGQISAIKGNTENGMSFDINEVLCYDQAADIAILKTNEKTRLDLLTLGSSSNLGKGSRVVAIGSPLGLLNTITEGIYSGIIYDDADYILFSAAISSGSSGGALFNEDGEVIGVTAATYTEGQNLNLAVPIENVIKLWDLYKNGNYVEVPPIEIEDDIPKSHRGSVNYITSHSDEFNNQLVEVVGYYYPNDPGNGKGIYLLSESEVNALERLQNEYYEALNKSKNGDFLNLSEIHRIENSFEAKRRELLSKSVIVFIEETYNIKQGNEIRVKGILTKKPNGSIYIGNASQNAVIVS